MKAQNFSGCSVSCVTCAREHGAPEAKECVDCLKAHKNIDQDFLDLYCSVRKAMREHMDANDEDAALASDVLMAAEEAVAEYHQDHGHGDTFDASDSPGFVPER
jgi:hypothetical protein